MELLRNAPHVLTPPQVLFGLLDREAKSAGRCAPYFRAAKPAMTTTAAAMKYLDRTKINLAWYYRLSVHGSEVSERIIWIGENLGARFLADGVDWPA